MQLQSATGNISLSDGASGTLPINSVTWTGNYTYAGDGNPLDPDKNWTLLNFSFTTTQTINIDNVSATLTQSGSIAETWTDDYLLFSGGPTVSLNVDGYQVDVTPLGWSQSLGAGWSGPLGPNGLPIPVNEDLTASFSVTSASVPEPATLIVWSLLGAASWLGMRVVRKGRRISRQPWSNENRTAILEIVGKR